MDANDLIKVLWVEDDPDVTSTYPLEAENYDLELVPIGCWDDARVELENKFNQWSAIILDAKCRYHRDSDDNAIVFLREALDDISTICEKKGRIIPWYVLTGGDESEVSDSINDKRLKWDKDWTDKEKKKYYSKDLDRDALYDRIRFHNQKSFRLQIFEMYKNAAEQLLQLNKDVYEDVLTILETMHFPKSHPDFTPRLFYNPMRKALEYVYRYFGKAGIIPEEFFSKGNVNLNQCFMFLIGHDAEKLGYRYGNAGDKIVPRHIHDMMSLIINLGNSNSHSTDYSHSTELSEDEIYDYDNQINSAGVNSRFLIFSMALQFCVIVQWMNRYIKDHPNKEDNMKMCVKLETTDPMPNISPNDLIGIIEVDNKLFHVGTKFGVHPGFVVKNGLVGKRVKIIKYDFNTDEKAKEHYPYFASIIQPIE